MAETTGISWCDATFNPVIGCTEVGPGCTNCYARVENERRKWAPGWGAGAPRYRTSASNWKKVLAWHRHPENLIGSRWPGRKPRVFCASLSDVFDNEWEPLIRVDLWALIAACTNLQWLLTTKRISNVEKMLPPDWCEERYGHVVLIITVCNQDEWNRDGPRLKALKKKYPWLKVGLSCEPLLGRIDLCEQLGMWWNQTRGTFEVGPEFDIFLDWVICGGESGPHARLMPPEWARALERQCRGAGIPFHFKQVGSKHDGWEKTGCGGYCITGKGGDPAEWPEGLRERAFVAQ